MKLKKITWWFLGGFFVLQILASISSFLVLFLENTPAHVNDSFFLKLMTNEFFTTLEWCFALPSIFMGSTFLSVPQIILMSYLVGFVVQIIMEKILLKFETSIDSFVAMAIILFAVLVSQLNKK